jgi:hypothetical protein
MGIWDEAVGRYRYYRRNKSARVTKNGVLSVAIIAARSLLRREPGRRDGLEFPGDHLLSDDALIGAAADGFETCRGERAARDDVGICIDSADVGDGGEHHIVARNHQGDECGAMDAGSVQNLGIGRAAGDHMHPPCRSSLAGLGIKLDDEIICAAASEKFDEGSAG